MNHVGSNVIEEIQKNRPYSSIKDFMKKCPVNKTVMINLIKGGAFDKLEAAAAAELNIHPRIFAMAYYLSYASEPKTRLTLQNFNGLMEKGLVPNELNFEKKTFAFNKYLKTKKSGEYYLLNLNSKDITFFEELYGDEELEVINNIPCIKQKTWDKIYKQVMENARDWLKENQTQVLKQLNQQLFKETWDKYATGNISSWEMEALCFYYHDHELKNVNVVKYGIADFNKLSTEPIVDRTFKRNGKEIPLFKLSRIAGTVISKNDARSSIALLTTTGVVNVKFTKDYFALFGRQISELQADGTKKVREKGWFVRGTKLLITGFRREDTFVSKNYKSNGGHQLYKILEINNGNLVITHERWSPEAGAEQFAPA